MTSTFFIDFLSCTRNYSSRVLAFSSAEVIAIRFEIVLEATHPVFAGHFPDYPVVPGALLLAHIGRELERIHDLLIVGVDRARFARPVLPGDTVVVDCDAQETDKIRFRCAVGEETVAQGSLIIGGARA